PDNRTVAISESWYTMPITLLNVETGQRRELPGPPDGSSDSSPRCSPDGKWIAFRRSMGHSNIDIYVVSASEGEIKRLTFDGAAKLGHCWTPDSQGIVFKVRLQNRWKFWYA